MTDLIDIFSTPIYQEKLSLNLDKLKSYCYRFRDQDNGGCLKSNRNSYHSSSLDFHNETLEPLHDQILDNASIYMDKLGAAGKIKMHSMWININPFGGVNVPHIHPGAFISGVVYIQSTEHSGNIYFQNPNSVEFDWASKFFKNPVTNTYCNDMWDFVPENGTLYLFPSWAKHGVHANMSNIDRISISFNLVSA